MLRKRGLTVSIVAAGCLLNAAYLYLLEQKQWQLCQSPPPENQYEFYAWLTLPWLVIVMFQMFYEANGIFRILNVMTLLAAGFYALIGFDQTAIDYARGIGLWMPQSLYCGRYNWFDFTLVQSLYLLVVGPLALTMIAVAASTFVFRKWKSFASHKTVSL